MLPEFLSVKAEPSKEYLGNIHLLGSYKIDDDGVHAQDVELVKDGYLKTLLSSRVPTKRVRQSNGHDRGGAAMLSVIEMTADKAHTKTRKDLIKQMNKLCKDRELPFGIVVKKAMNQNILYTTLFRLTNGEFSTSPGSHQVPLIELYKVYPDGREELIRGCSANGFTVQSFKDLLNIGDKAWVMNYLAPAVTSPFYTGGSQYIGSTVIVPDLLFEDGEIKPMEEDFPKPPILKNPISLNK